jgi:DNA primase
MDSSSIKNALKEIGYTSTDWDYYDRKNQIQCKCFFANLRDEHDNFFHDDGDDDNFSRGIDVDPSENDAITNCFACNKSGSLSYLLKEAYEISGDPKFKKASELCGQVNINTVKNRKERIFENEKMLGEDEDEDYEETYDDSELDIFKKAIHSYILDERGFDIDIAKKFELHFDDKLKRVLIPVRNKYDNLVGLVGRSIYSEEEREKIRENMKNKPDYLVRKYTKRYYNYLNFSKSNFLFGANLIPDNPDRIIVVEGCTDVMRLHQYGLQSSVGVFGSNISDNQSKKLLNIGEPVYLLLDPDNSGKRGKSEAINKMGQQIKVYDAQLPQGKDPDDCSKSTINNVLNDARLVV